MTATINHAAELKRVKEHASELVDFDADALRRVLFRAAGQELSQVASSSNEQIGFQLDVIRRSLADFESFRAGMDAVQSHVAQIDANVGNVVTTAFDSSEELQQVSQRMSELEEHCKAIAGLVTIVNEIADRTNLLALNATIEAARAGEAGKGFAVVASEVKELSKTTKEANHEINLTLEKVGKSVSSLSAGVERSVEKMQQAVEAIKQTRESASSIGAETARVGEKLQESSQNFHNLDSSSDQMSNEVHEIDAIGRTFNYLLELMAMEQRTEPINPLERLAPLVEGSDFLAAHRFANDEPEYVLQDDDILISATDTQGKITFANNTFYRIAEYEPGELLGAPHNIIRHPDMPRAAFADLWATIQAGKLWQGYVANRSQSGRLYWVKASVFPAFENGAIIGFISVRTKPEADWLAKAIEAYRLVP
ncbi:MAG: PAS domain-containing protein [Planctomycetales bacterium]|nr:PAS domain-containing protein [Planctomycetales bacterium]